MTVPSVEALAASETIWPQTEGEQVDGGQRLYSAAPYADDTLALKFTDEFGEILRYTAAWGKWAIWTGSVWKPDATYAVFDLARKICRAESVACGDQRMALRIASAQTVAAVVQLARSDRRHTSTVDQWDSDPWLLNTPGGVVDLRTGKVCAARQEDFMTKLTAAVPGGTCPTWHHFLEQVTDSQRDVQRFLQRISGYALTGTTREHALFFLFGTGANGKSVFLNTISGLLGDYAKTSPIETFTDHHTQNHPTELASLQGARLVSATETENGRNWAESKLKMLTGGDRISARKMRQDFYEFTPQFKLVIAGNHMPSLRNIDEAIRRRFHLLPFVTTIPASQRDPELTEKLRAEWPGILQWMIEGCLAWQREGLNPPNIVKEATEAYFTSEDALGRWLEDRTDKKTRAWSSSTSLFNDWKTWAESNGEIAGTQKAFSQNLVARKYQRHPKNTGSGFDGIALKTCAVVDGGGSPYYRRHARTHNGDNRNTLHNPPLQPGCGEGGASPGNGYQEVML